MVKFFPSDNRKVNSEKLVPAYIFGDRLFADQGKVELLSELLLICFSKKQLNGSIVIEDEPFPKLDQLYSISNIEYFPKYRVLFKLFALYDHQTGDGVVKGFEGEYEKIIASTSKSFMSVSSDSFEDKKKQTGILQALYKGFQEVGSNRDWCAQSFLPVSKSLIAGESIWVKAKAKNLDSYSDAKDNLKHDKRSFYARSGEVLYLQLLSALNHTKADVDMFLASSDRYKNLKVSEAEKDPNYLRYELNKGFNSLYECKSPDFFNELIDSFSESEDGQKSVEIGFIPEETWIYGFLFAIELSRFFKSSFDIVDTVKHLENACVLQEIRTMLGESSRKLNATYPILPVVAPDCNNIRYKMISNEAFKYCQRQIKDALDLVADEVGLERLKSVQHSRYGHKLFSKLAKSIGFVLPPKGGLDHFVLSKDLIVLLVSTTLCPQDEILTLDSFLTDLKIRYGIVVDSDGFCESNKQIEKLQEINDLSIYDWFIDTLMECAYYVQLSDSLSLVKNTNVKG